MARNTWMGLYNEDPKGIEVAGTAVANTTTALTLFAPWDFPKHYLKPGRFIIVRARGVYSVTATPTIAFRLQDTAGTTGTIVTHTAITTSSGVTTQGWDLDIAIRTVSDGTSGAVLAHGILNLGTTATASTSYYLPASGTAPANYTIDTTAVQTWDLQVTWSAASASNTITGHLLQVIVAN